MLKDQHNSLFLIISFLTNSCEDQSFEAHKDKIKNNAKGYEADTAVATLFAEGTSAQMCLFFKLLGNTGARSLFCKYHNQLAWITNPHLVSEEYWFFNLTLSKIS